MPCDEGCARLCHTLQLHFKRLFKKPPIPLFIHLFFTVLIGVLTHKGVFRGICGVSPHPCGVYCPVLFASGQDGVGAVSCRQRSPSREAVPAVIFRCVRRGACRCCRCPVSSGCLISGFTTDCLQRIPLRLTGKCPLRTPGRAPLRDDIATPRVGDKVTMVTSPKRYRSPPKNVVIADKW